MRFSLLLFFIIFFSEGFINLPQPLPEEFYGNTLIDKVSTSNNVKAVVFPHWIHRVKFTCRVCHFEMEFSMEKNTTEISCARNKEGQFCGSCHNGKTSFAITEENCARCHTGDIYLFKDKYLAFKNSLKIKEKEKIDWNLLLEKKLISPKTYLNLNPSKDMEFDKTLELEAEFHIIPPAIFSHKTHRRWLDCNNCHPDIFNIKKKGTHFLMSEILNKKYCGVCHTTVAFPMNECKRCHPKIKKNYF